MIISFEVFWQERGGALPLHDTRIVQSLRRPSLKQLPLSDRLQFKARNHVAAKEPGFLRAVDAPWEPCLRTELVRTSSMLFGLRHTLVGAFVVQV